MSLGTLGLLLSGCSLHTDNKWWNQTMNFGFPTGITPEGVAIREFWTGTVITSLIVGFFVWGLIFWSMAFHRKRKNDDGEFPRQTAYNVPLELIYTAAPFVIISVLFYFTVVTQNKVLDLRPQEEVGVKVDVTAYQWNWKFGYGELGSEFAPAGGDYDGVDEARQASAEASKVDPSGNNPIHGNSKKDMSYLHYNQIETLGTTDEVPVLVLPTNTPIEFNLASADVAHSFWVPEFLFKRDLYAHPEANKSQRVFQVEEIFEEGAFVGRCAEMCGTYHAMMNFELRTVDRETFAEYIAFRDANPDATNAQALEHIGEAPYATSTAPFVSDRTGTRDGENFQTPA